MKNYLIIIVLLSSPLFIFGQNDWSDSGTFAYASITENIGTNVSNVKRSSNKVVLLPKVVTAFKPVIDVTENHIDLKCLSEGNPICVSVFSENDKIFTDVYEKQRSISKRYDTSKLPRGSYTFNVSSGNTTYSKKFSK